MLSAWLVWTVLLLPHGFGLAGLWRMEQFRRESFGHLRRATVLMMLTIVLGLVAYALITANGAASGWVDEMQRWPLSRLGAALYLQAIVAAATLGAFFGAGYEAWLVTIPKAMAFPGAPREAPRQAERR